MAGWYIHPQTQKTLDSIMETTVLKQTVTPLFMANLKKHEKVSCAAEGRYFRLHTNDTLW
jgi:energy-coupling factor transporter transmembrane protein EcfT